MTDDGTKKTPYELYVQAEQERSAAVTKRYLELMKQEGYLIERKAGDNDPLLPCGHDPREGRIA